jgi:hypothetical protein
VGRTCRHDAHVAHGVQMRQMFPKPAATAFDGDLLHRDLHSADLAGRSSGEVNLDGCQQFAAAEGRPRSAAAQQCLVNVVKEYRAEPLAAEPRQSAAERLG